jgi:hypothetical protein
MFANPAWTVDVTRVLTRREFATVLADAQAQAERSLIAQRNQRARPAGLHWGESCGAWAAYFVCGVYGALAKTRARIGCGGGLSLGTTAIHLYFFWSYIATISLISLSSAAGSNGLDNMRTESNLSAIGRF